MQRMGDKVIFLVAQVESKGVYSDLMVLEKFLYEGRTHE